MERIQVYADGGCRGNQSEENLGAWGFTMSYKGKILEKAEIEENTTNNKQELMAVIKVLEHIKTTQIPIDIHVDSAYVYNGMSSWIFGWKKKNWRSSSNKPVKNVDLWKKLDALANKQSDICWVKVKGHEDDEGNNRADLLVNEAMDRFLKGDV